MATETERTKDRELERQRIEAFEILERKGLGLKLKEILRKGTKSSALCAHALFEPNSYTQHAILAKKEGNFNVIIVNPELEFYTESQVSHIPISYLFPEMVSEEEARAKYNELE